MFEPRFGIVRGNTVQKVLESSPEDVAGTIRDAYLAHDRGQTENPNSFFLRYKDRPRQRIIGLPASIEYGTPVSGIKWIASNPDNVAKGFPRASAVLVLNDFETGYPYACLESSIISATRTSVSAVLGAEHLNHGLRVGKRLGFIGTGLIASYVYRYFKLLDWQIDEVVCHDLDKAYAEKFCAAHIDAGRHGSVSVSESLDDVLTSSDLIVFTTSALVPYVTDPALFAHNPTVLHVSLRDLNEDILLGSHNIVDDIEHVLNANSSPHLVEQRVGHRDFIDGTLAGLIEGKFTVSNERPRIFSPFGLGVLDIALGRYVYSAAEAAGEVIDIPGFFHELVR